MELTIRNRKSGMSEEDILEVRYAGNIFILNMIQGGFIHLSPEEAAVLAEVLKQYSEKWGKKK
jgi:hypothetical protein